MCVTCGCGQTAATDKAIGNGATAGHHHHHHGADAHHHHHPDGAEDTRLIRLEQDLLGKNNRIAAANRRFFRDRGIFALNLVSSPGSGKTTLLARTAEELKARFPIAVIEGDQNTSLDAERIRRAGVPAVQVNTGRVCHLDAAMIGRAVEELDPSGGVLFVENVGNLVCPAEFDLGEAHKVAVVSVTEGEDKPLKYPHMFAAAGLMLINKIDLLPHVTFDTERCRDYARRANPDIEILEISATTGTGLPGWYEWIERGVGNVTLESDRAPSEVRAEP